MVIKVLDSWALIAFFEDEPAAEAVEKLLSQAAADKHKLLLSVVNWGEIYYNTMREVSQEAAEQMTREIAALPIEIIPVAEDLIDCERHGSYRASHGDACGHQPRARRPARANTLGLRD